MTGRLTLFTKTGAVPLKTFLYSSTVSQLPRTEDRRVPDPSELVFQSGVSSWLTWGVHPNLHPGVEESRPERHRVPLPDFWSAGIPTGAAHSPFPHRLRCLLSALLPCIIPSFLLLSLPRSLTYCSSSLLSYHSFRPSSLFCIVIHIPLRFIFSHDTCSIVSPRFHSECLLSSLTLHLICLSLSRALSLCRSPSIIFRSPLSFTFIVIHVRSMMKRSSPSVSP